jgi:hypothetical protein
MPTQVPKDWLVLQPGGCCVAHPPREALRKQVAVCIAGQVPRIFAQVEQTIQDNVIAPLGNAADTFLAVSGQMTRPPKLPYANISHVPPSHSSEQLIRMATTMAACYPMITHAEARLRYEYSWVMRLRTDGVYTFTWGAGSSWVAAPPEDRAVYTTHCASREPFKANDCAKDLPHEQECIADQFAVMTRSAAAAYLTGILAIT